MRILNVAAGVLLIAAGIYCLCNQDAAVLSAGLLLGVFLLVAGIAEIVVFAATSSVMIGSGWLLLDSGVSQFVSAFDLRALGVRAWGWVLVVGIVLTVAGFVCMMDPWVSVTAMGMTVGIVFVLEGVSSIVCACISRTKEL